MKVVTDDLFYLDHINHINATTVSQGIVGTMTKYSVKFNKVSAFVTDNLADEDSQQTGDFTITSVDNCKQEARLMLTTGSTRLAVSRGQQTWYHSTCYI